MNKRAERETYGLEKHYEVHDHYMWSQSMKHGWLLECWVDGVLEILICDVPYYGFRWMIRGRVVVAQPSDGKGFFASIEECKQDALEYAIALLHETYMGLLEETGIRAVFTKETNHEWSLHEYPKEKGGTTES